MKKSGMRYYRLHKNDSVVGYMAENKKRRKFSLDGHGWNEDAIKYDDRVKIERTPTLVKDSS